MDKEEAFDWLIANTKYEKRLYLKCPRCEKSLWIKVFDLDDKEEEIEVECLCGFQKSHFVPR